MEDLTLSGQTRNTGLFVEGLCTMGNLLGLLISWALLKWVEPFAGLWTGCYFSGRLMKNIKTLGTEKGRKALATRHINWKILGYEHPTDLENIGSFPRREGSILNWTTYRDMKPLMEEKEGIYLMDFKLSEISKNIIRAQKEARFGIPQTLAGMLFPPYMLFEGFQKLTSDTDAIIANMEKPVYISPIDLTKSMLVLGSMGTGKSVFLKNILAQKPAKRYVIHDVKGEYLEAFWEEGDIIYNPYDARSGLWAFLVDIAREPSLADVVANSIATQVSNEKDFWISASANLLKSAIWFAIERGKGVAGIVEYVERFRKKAVEERDRTKMSIVATLEPVLDALELLAFLEEKAVEEGREDLFFTLDDFIQDKSGRKLFLLNSPAHTKALAPLFNAFISALLSKLLSRPDTKEDFTMFLLDEFLNFNMPEEVLVPTFTIARSKGVQLVFAAQFLPDIHDQKNKSAQLVLSSRYITVIFKIQDEKTLSLIENVYGDIEFITSSESASFSYSSTVSYGGGNGLLGTRSSTTSFSGSEQKSRGVGKILTKAHIHALPRYHAIVHISDPFKLFMGRVEKERMFFNEVKKTEPYVQRDLREFLRHRAMKAMKHIEIEEEEKKGGKRK